MTCNDIEGKLTAFQEGTLSLEEKNLVEDHLDTCPKCTSVLADLEKTAVLLKNLPDVEPPPWFTQKIMAKVREEAEHKDSLLQKLFYPLRVKIPLEAFAALLVVIMGVYIYQSTTPETRTVVQTPQAKIQQPTHTAVTPQESTRAVKDASETKGQTDFVSPLSKEKTHTPIPPTEKFAPSEQQQRAATPSLPAADMTLEKKHEGIREAPRSQQAPASSPVPLAREKDAMGVSGALQKDEQEQKKARTSQPSKSTLAVKQAVTTLSVQVADVHVAIQEIERILAKFGAQDVTRDSRDGNEYINAQLQAKKTVELLHQLSVVGDVKQKDISKESKEGIALFRIEVSRDN